MGINVLPEISSGTSGSGRLRTPALVLAVVVAGAAAGSFAVVRSGSGSKPAASGKSAVAAPVTAVAAHGWKRTGLNPVSQPLAVGGRIVVFAAAKGVLSVVGLDAKTGATVWTDRASSSDNAPGIGPALAVVGGMVVYLRTEGRDFARVVAANASTGQVVWSSASGVFSSFPELCPGESQTICLSGYLGPNAEPGTLLRFDAYTGVILDGAPIPLTARSVGVGLYDSNDSGSEYLISPDAGAINWARNLSQIFPIPGASSDWGWNFDRIPQSGLFVGSVAGKPLSETATHITVDMSRTMTAGFRISDGSVVWRDNGTTYACTGLPCVGSTTRSDADSISANVPGPTIGVRTRMTGTASGTLGGDDQTVSPGSRVAIEGFNPSTGRTLWSFAAGNVVALLSADVSPPLAAAHSVVIPDAAGKQVVLNLANGATTPTGTGTLWCGKDVTYKQNFAYAADDGRSITEYEGQTALFPCDVKEHRLPVPAKVPAFVGAQGTTAGGLVIWSDTNAIVAAPEG